MTTTTTTAAAAAKALARALATAKAISTEIIEGKLIMVFGNGESLSVDPAALSPEIRLAAMLHGLKQKLGDAAAISRNPDTGRSASLDDKIAAVREVFDRITSPDGTWNKVRESGDGSGNGGLLFRALCNIYAGRRTPEQITAFLEDKTEAEKAALRKSFIVAKEIERLRPAPKAGNGDDLLAELDD